MDTSSPFAATRTPAQLESVSLDQLLAHIRASDQTEAFVQEAILNSPVRSVATTFVSRSSKRSGIISSKRSGIIVCNRDSSDSDSSDTETAITCSSIGSVSRRTIGGAAVRKNPRKKSLHSAWFDDEDEKGNSDSSSDEEDISAIAALAHSRSAQLSPSKRSIEDLKNLSMFDPSFSFSRTCVTTVIDTEQVSPLDSWYL